MDLRAFATIDIARPREDVFDYAAAYQSFSQFLLKRGPIAGVAKAEMLDGAAPVTGALRRITMTDGATLDERILAMTRPSRHHYQWATKLKPPLRWLVKTGVADWQFIDLGGDLGGKPAPGQTRIDWTYTLTLTTPLVYPLAAIIISLFRRWMADGLTRIRDHVTAPK